MSDVPSLRASRVPVGRVERFLRFGVMAGSMAASAAVEGAKRWWSGEGGSLGDLVVSGMNPQQLAQQLSRMRGAAMKLGQLLSLEGAAVLPPELSEALAMLRASGDTMTHAQLHGVLGREYGHGWERRFQRFEETPVAAASIGQVHRAVAADGRTLALKIQFPGVSKSIGSDVDNLGTLLRMTHLVPEGFDLKPMLVEVKRQLQRETDYVIEAQSLMRYRALAMAAEPEVRVPRAHDDLTTKRILAMDFVDGIPVSELWGGPWPQVLRDRVALLCQRLVLREVFEFRFLQSDPNFANFLFDPVCEGLVLLDFGSMVEVSATMAERYRRLVRAARVADRGRLRALALEFGWLAAGDPEPQQEGLVDLILLSTEPLRLPGVYNYGASDLAARTHDASMELAFERGLLRPPPPELLFIHRKLGGTYLLCASLKARVDSAALAASFVA